VALVGLALAAAVRRGPALDAAAATGVMAALVASAALHHPLESAAGRLALALGAGLALAPAHTPAPQPGQPPRQRALLAAGLLAAGLLAAVSLLAMEDPGSLLAQAKALSDAGRHHDALPLWQGYAALAPPTPRARLRLARAEMRAGHARRAEQRLQALLTDWPHHEAAHLTLGALLIETGRSQEALRSLARVRSPLLGPRARDLEAVAGP
jgi:thioredoxin-like negative regulator of GroEL